MKNLKHIIFSVLLSIALFISVCPKFVYAQEKPMGELTIESNAAAGGDQFITLNGERVVSGRSVMSPADIETPAQTAAKILLPKTGIIKVSPSSKMNLYFENASISGDFLKGNITVDALPYTKFNILTPEGAITASNLNNENVFVVNLIDNKIQVNVLAGEVLFNGVLVIAGQTYPAQTTDANTAKNNNSGSANSNNLIYIVLGAAGAAALIAALSLSGGGSDNNSNVSPIR